MTEDWDVLTHSVHCCLLSASKRIDDNLLSVSENAMVRYTASPAVDAKNHCPLFNALSCRR